MRIRAFHVDGLNGKTSFDLNFNEDLNLLTGRNGSGKTTVLKLIWYMISGNLERILPEIRFRHAHLETNLFTLTLMQREPDKLGQVGLLTWSFLANGAEEDKGSISGPETARLRQTNAKIAMLSGSSLFFPTFRRIEGGFSMPHGQRRTGDDVWATAGGAAIESSLTNMAQTLSVRRHRFVASISTTDIVSSLTSHYANVSEQLNVDHRELSADIINQIKQHDDQAELESVPADKLSLSHKTLDSIREQVKVHQQKQEQLLKPFSSLSDLIVRIFKHKGIRVSARLAFGETAGAIASEQLSAGEKQMLSFLVYNAFEDQGIIFIDEPEISLHVDWQRQLFPTLLEQGSTNQFIVATHSPFIYTRYTDKELILHPDRGEG